MRGPFLVHEGPECLESTAEAAGSNAHLVDRVRKVSANANVVGDERPDVLAKECSNRLAGTVLRADDCRLQNVGRATGIGAQRGGGLADG